MKFIELKMYGINTLINIDDVLMFRKHLNDELTVIIYKDNSKDCDRVDIKYDDLKALLISHELVIK